MKMELGHEQLLELVLTEALRDGAVDEREAERVETLKFLLGVSDEQYQAAFQRASARVTARKGEARSMDRQALYEQCLLVAAADGTFSDIEKSAIKILKGLLGLTAEEHAAAVTRVKGYLTKRRPGA